MRILRGVPEALRLLKDAGFLTFIITNQSGIERGLMTEDQYRAVEAEVLRPRQAGAGAIDAVYFCADLPETDSPRRKPAPGMVLEAAAPHGIDLARSFLIGDKAADIECGRRAGTRTILVRIGYGSKQDCEADYAADFADAVEWVLRSDRLH